MVTNYDYAIINLSIVKSTSTISVHIDYHTYHMIFAWQYSILRNLCAFTLTGDLSAVTYRSAIGFPAVIDMFQNHYILYPHIFIYFWKIVDKLSSMSGHEPKRKEHKVMIQSVIEAYRTKYHSQNLESGSIDRLHLNRIKLINEFSIWIYGPKNIMQLLKTPCNSASLNFKLNISI